MSEQLESAAERFIYLDHQATTPMDPRVIDAMVEAMQVLPGNPNSVEHRAGLRAAGAIEEARREVATLIGAEPEDVHFTASASDAIAKALAIATSGEGISRVAAMPVEHPAMIDVLSRLQRAGRIELGWLAVDGRAQLDLASLNAALGRRTDLVCLMLANNEVGTIYPFEAVLEACRSRGARLLVDATQAAGRLDLTSVGAGADYLILSSHKMYGPKGVGVLVAPGGGADLLEPLGHQGTPNVAAIVGLGVAARLARVERVTDCDWARELRDDLQERLAARLPFMVVNGDVTNRLPHTLHISLPGIPNDALLARLGRSVAISSGAACSSGAQAPSHVLRAMGLAEPLVDSALRLSTGRFTTRADVAQAANSIAEAVNEIRAAHEERIAC